MSRDLILVAVALMTWGTGEGMFLYFQPLYLEKLGADPVKIGFIMGLTGLCLTLAHLPAGYLADRLGRRPLLIGAWWFGTVAAWIMALSTSLPSFVLGAVLYGTTAFVIAPLNSYVTAARGSLGVGRALTLISATYSIGAMLGPLLGGWVGSHAGLRTNFQVGAIIFLVSSLMILFIRPQPVEENADERQRPRLSERLSALLRPRFVQYLAITFIAIFCIYLPQPLSQNFLQNQRGIGLAEMGVLIAARGLGVVILNLILGQLKPRYGFLLAQLASAGFAALLWLGGGFPAYLLGYVLMGSYNTARSLSSAQGRDLVESNNMGLGYGVLEAAMSLAIILAPPLAGILYNHNPAWVYSTSLGLILFSIIAVLFFSPLRGRQPIQVENSPTSQLL